jgi:hypothetical protein
LVNAITRFAAPAAVAGGHTGATAAAVAGTVVEEPAVVLEVDVIVVEVVVVDFDAVVGFFVPPPESRATKAMITPMTTTSVIDLRTRRDRRSWRSWTASF